MPSVFDVLRDAARAYYETDTPVLTDEEYDALVEEARALDPQNPFFTQVGATPAAGRVALPVPMPSLRKIKPDTFSGWNHSAPNGYVLSDKLDGISALWVCGYNQTPGLFLRGDGLVGQDCTSFAKQIRGLLRPSVPSCIVRGELILPRAAVKEGTAARNWVNGILHRSDAADEDIRQIQFLAYEVCSPANLTRSQQFTWLQNQGFTVPWHQHVGALTVPTLEALFQTRRTESAYECDGLVVGVDLVPVKEGTTLPRDCVAFKMPIDEQKATTTVTAIEWASSRNRIWVPRIVFTPVQIGTATITCCTGVHAANIEQKRIGPGARIVVRRSGDVIPIVDSVLHGAEPQMPPGAWEWDANHVQALDTRTEVSVDTKAVWLTHSLATFGYEGIRATSAKKLVEGGFESLLSLLKADREKLQACIGPKTAQSLLEGLPVCMKTATTVQWVRAYPQWPKGFGETRIQSVLNHCADISKWPTSTPPKGMSVAVFSEIQKCVGAYLEWRDPLMGCVGTVSTVSTVSTVRTIPPVKERKGSFAMSGFRDKALVAKLEEAGWECHETVKKSTTVLLVPDDAKETTKVAAARAGGVRIVPRSQVGSLL